MRAVFACKIEALCDGRKTVHFNAKIVLSKGSQEALTGQLNAVIPRGTQNREQ